VVIQFDEPAAGVVRVRFAQLGWQSGDEWDRGYANFDAAWGWVLGAMREHLESSAETTTEPE
jgi:hypothetical protein